jgi:hypothetical protein
MVLQAESVQKFLAPCIHWVIINEEIVDIAKCKSALSPYYKNHTLRLLTLKDFKPINSTQGWVRQQVLKLRISEFTDNDYLLIDTKFFFVKPTNLDFWKDKIGNGNLYTLNNSVYSCWKPASQLYADKLNLPIINDVFFAFPFKIKIEYLKDVDMDFLQACLLLKPENGYASEFVLYSYLARNEINHGTGKLVESKDIPYITPIDIRNLSDIESLTFLVKKANMSKTDPDLKIFGLHPNYLKTASPRHFMYINYYLKSLSLSTVITPESIE